MVSGRIWIETAEGALLGKGRIELLKGILEHGSLNKAAKALRMSYRQAWELVDSMNTRSPAPLVVLMKGGKHGGGARLTEAGRKAVKEFDRMSTRFRKFLEKESDKFML